MADLRICSIPDCRKPVYGRGWCGAHYRRWFRYGNPMGGDTPRGDTLGSPSRFYREVVLIYDGDECLIWPFAIDGGGYGRLRWNGKHTTVSRLVCEALNGSPPTPAHDAAHSCGNGHLGCVAKRHLSWKTKTENQRDRINHGTVCDGERHPLAKLTEADVREIRALRGSCTQREIAARFRVSESLIGLIHQRKLWVHV